MTEIEKQAFALVNEVLVKYVSSLPDCSCGFEATLAANREK